MPAGILGISSWLHANTSRLSLRKLTIPSFVSGLKFVSIWVIFSGLPSNSSMVSRFSGWSLVFFLQSSTCGSPWRPGRLDNILLPRPGPLLSLDPLFCWEFYLQAVRGSGNFPAVEGWSTYDHIVGLGWIYHQKIVSVGHLERMWTSYNSQRHYSPRVHLVSAKTDKGWVERTKSFLVYFQLLEGGDVDYVSRTPIIHQDSSSVEPFDHDHNDQGSS